MAQTLLLIAEGPTDHRTVTTLADRVVSKAISGSTVDEPGLMDPRLAALREWGGIVPETPFTAWRDIKELAARNNIRVLGGQKERGLDRDKFRKALLLAEKLRKGGSRWMVVSRDLHTDHPDDRRSSLEEVRDEYQGKGWTIVLALAQPFREAWVLNGFRPMNSDESKTLAAERSKLGFDPTHFPEKLDAQLSTAKKNGKRVLEVLCCCSGDSREREDQCLEQCDLDHLHKSGKGSGLSKFLLDVESILVPRLLAEG